MGIKLIDRINSCGDYSIIQDSLYYVKHSNLYKYPSEIIIELKDYWGVHFELLFFNVFTNRSSHKFYDYLGNKICEFEKRNFYHFFSSNDFIYFDRFSKKTKYNDLNIYNGKIGGNFLYDKTLFIPQNRSIIALDYTSTEIRWQYDLEDLGTYNPLHEQGEKKIEVAKFLGLWKNELLIACNGGLLLSINQNTGVLKRQWQGLPEQADSYLQNIFKGQLPRQGYLYQLNKANSRVEAFFLHYYFYIDLDSGKMHLTNCKQNLLNHNIEYFKYSTAYSEDANHLYTKITYDQVALGVDYIPTGLCAFNKMTSEIDWQYRFDKHDDYLATEIPRISGKNIYQKSAGNTLYIFQKENES